MRIVHVIMGFDVAFPGGITNYVRTLADSQVAAGHDVIVLDGGDGTRSHAGGWVAHGHRGNLRPFVASVKDDVEGTERLNQLVHNSRPDVVHFHLTVGLGTDFYPRFARQKIPYVVSVHDYYLACPRITMIDWRGQNCGGPARDKCERCIGALDQVDVLYKAARRLSVTLPRVPSKKVTDRKAKVGEFLASATRVLPVSTRVQELMAMEYPDLKYSVVHIGNGSATTERPLRTPSQDIRLTFLGVLSEHKGAEVLAEIARGVSRPDVRFVFHGRAEKRWVGPMEAAGVTIRGPYAPGDLPRIMSDTDIGLVLPVWEDNGPQVAMEFINYGVPVLGTRMGGIPDFVTKETGHLIEPTSEGAWEAVKWIQGLDRDQVVEWGRSLPRLTTPQQHHEQLADIYATAAG